MSDDDHTDELGMNFTDTWNLSAPAPTTTTTSSSNNNNNDNKSSSSSKHEQKQKLNRKEMLEQKRKEKLQKQNEQRDIAAKRNQKLLEEEAEDNSEDPEVQKNKSNKALSALGDRFAVAGSTSGTGLSLTRQEKQAKPVEKEVNNKGNKNDSAADQAENKKKVAAAQQQQQPVRKYESFVRDPAPSANNKDSSKADDSAATTRTPFDDKKFSVPTGFTIKKQEPPKNNNNNTTSEELMNRKQRRQRQRDDDEEQEEQESEFNTGTVVDEATVPTTEEVINRLHPRLKSAVDEKLNFSSLTYVQRASFTPISDIYGGDVVIRSETGSGKTLAYALPLVNQIVVDSDTFKIDRTIGTLMIVMVPTRELAEQCASVIMKLVARSAFVICGCIHGGDDRHKEKSRLRKGIHVLVATPGRLLDHLHATNSFVRNELRYVVLDEADRLLDMGFERAISEIMQLIPKPRKRVLVSATVTNAVERLKHFVLQPPLTTVGNTEDVFEVPDTLSQKFVSVPPKHRLVSLAALLWSRLLNVVSPQQHDASYTTYVPPSRLKTAKQRVVCFVSTSDAVEFLYLMFSRLASPFYTTNKPNQQQQHSSSDSSFGGGGAHKVSVKKLTEEANQHLGQDGGVSGNGVVEFDSDDDTMGGGAGMDPRVARAQFFLRQQQQAQEDHASREFVLSDEDAFLRGANIFKLHGNMSQVDRQAVYENFKKSDCAVLFCTDVAARGLDIPNVDLIIHYDPPIDERSYVHRVGRTARIGTKGESILFMMPHELAYVNHLSRATKKSSDTTTSTTATKPNEDAAAEDKNDNNNTQSKDAEDVEQVNTLTANQQQHPHEYSADARPNIKLLMPEMNLDVILFQLSKMDRKAGPGRHWVHSAAFMQRAMCDLARSDQLLRQVSLFAYQSYVRAYAGMPREVKKYFDQKQLHLGQIASSFANQSTPVQLQRDLKGVQMARRERNDARDANKIRKDGVSRVWDSKAKDGETYHSTLMKKAMFDTKDRIDEGTAGGMKVAATSSKAITEFEA